MSTAINNPRIQFKGLFLFFFFVFLATVKLYPSSNSNGNVEQWVNITNQFFYGQQDFLFSYGPLYWIIGGGTQMTGTAQQFSLASYWIALVFQSAMFALFWAALVSMANAARSIIFLAGLFFLFFGALNFSPALYLWPFLLVVYLDTYRPQEIQPRWYILLGVLVALASFIRFFWGIVALATFASYFFSRALVDRKFAGLAVIIGSALLSYFVIGLAVFHDHKSLINYLLINNQLSFGNSVDMTLDLANRSGTWVAVALIAIILNAYLLRRKRHLFITVNILFLLFLKLGFSRTDHYVNYFVPPVAVLLFLPLLDRSKFGRTTLLMAAAGLYYLLAVPSFPGAPVKNIFQPGTDFEVDYASRMESTYPGFKLNPELLGVIGQNTIDVYPYHNEYIFANKLNYKHRPLFQSYMTLTPKLGAMNQAFFESYDRPQFVLWTAGIMCTSSDCNPFDAFDNKYSLNEDPLTTSAILLNYHPVKNGSGKAGIPLVLMERNPAVTKYSEVLLSSQAGLEFGRWYKVPKSNGGLLKIKPELQFTLYGRAKNLLFRGDILKIKYKLTSGEIKEYRANILNAGSGLTVTPLPDSFNFSGPGPAEIMFEASDAAYFKPTFNAQWVTVPIPGLTVIQPYADARSETPPQHTREQVISCEGVVDFVNDEKYANQPVTVTGHLRLRGWLAASTGNGELFDKTFVVITDRHGKQSYVTNRTENRGDLVAVFKHASLSSAGYVASVDASQVDGPATAGLAGLKGDTLYRCSQYSVQFSVKPN